MNFKICFFLLSLTFEVVSNEKILLIMPMGSKSHFTIFEHLAEGLSKRGHTVTIVSAFTTSKQYQNVQVHKIDVPEAIYDREFQSSLFAREPKFSFSIITNISNHFASGCEIMFNNKEVKSLIDKGEKFDVAMVNGFMNECALPLGSILAKQLMFVFSMPIPHWIAHYFNIPTPLSTIPSMAIQSLPPFTFGERFLNTVSGYGYLIYYHYFHLSLYQSIVEKHLPEGTPTIIDSMKQVAFILANGDPVFSISRPSVPFLEDIGGIHLKNPNPLPKEMEDFVKSSKEDGVILFSFGSMVQARFMPKATRDVFLTAFSKLKQKVIWKFEEDIENLPPNVKIVKWMPQQDLLGHPKVRLFLTHCGRSSLQESAYHAVPVIGMPIYGDQLLNIAIVKDYGFGESLDVRNTTSNAVFSLINQVLNNKKYKEKAKEVSYILKDRLLLPLDQAIYWTEYVMRHKGAAHLRNKGAEQLNLFQYLLLDVFGVLAVALGIVVLIVATLLSCLIRLCFKKKKENKEKTH